MRPADRGCCGERITRDIVAHRGWASVPEVPSRRRLSGVGGRRIRLCAWERAHARVESVVSPGTTTRRWRRASAPTEKKRRHVPDRVVPLRHPFSLPHQSPPRLLRPHAQRARPPLARTGRSRAMNPAGPSHHAHGARRALPRPLVVAALVAVADCSNGSCCGCPRCPPPLIASASPRSPSLVARRLGDRAAAAARAHPRPTCGAARRPSAASSAAASGAACSCSA